jgi:hypothetical protein
MTANANAKIGGSSVVYMVLIVNYFAFGRHISIPDFKHPFSIWNATKISVVLRLGVFIKKGA